jgi:VWFA-related protein
MPWNLLRHRLLTQALVLLLTLGSYSGLNGAVDQQSSSPVSTSSDVLRANTRLVVVDVVVTDSKGRPVPDLKTEDFVLVEGGKPQKISAFTYEHGNGKAVATEQAQLPPSIISNAPRFQPGSLNIILFDANNGSFIEQAYARDELLKFLSSAELDRPVAIFAMGSQLKLLTDFTTDNKVLAAAIAKYKPPAQTTNTDSFESRESPFSSAGAFHTSDRTIESTLDQLNGLAKILAGYPGRKNLIWLSESFPLTLFPDSFTRTMSGQSNHSIESSGGPTTGLSPLEMMHTQSPYKSYDALVKKVTDALMAAQVAVYPVDAGALNKDDHLSAQHTMNEMAEGTGGKAFKNSNDLALSLKTSIEDGSTYYTLAYYPENRTWNGQFRSIQVKVDRPGLILRYRLGYYAVDPEKIKKEDSDAVAENFSRSLQLDAPSSTAVVFQAQVSPPSDKGKKVVVTFHVDPRSIAFEQKGDGKESAKLSCTVWAYGKNKEKPEMFSGTVSANLKPDEYQLIMQQHFLPCSQELDLKPGTYALRLGVLDRSSNKIGTASAMVAVQ